MRIALTIAGSDPSGGAGVQADLKTFAAHGVYGLSVITAVTAQSSLGVSAVEPVSSDVVTAQIEAVVSDMRPHAAKTGMLPTAAVVEAVAAAVADLDIPLLVVDPVMIATRGQALADADAIAAMKIELLRLAFVVTPNIPEAEALSGGTIRTDEDRRDAARRIVALGAAAVVIKGGHWNSADIVDLLYDGGEFVEFRSERVPTASTHGTGCTFAAAIAAALAKGASLRDAVLHAQQYVAGAIRSGSSLGHPAGIMNHFWEGS